MCSPAGLSRQQLSAHSTCSPARHRRTSTHAARRGAAIAKSKLCHALRHAGRIAGPEKQLNKWGRLAFCLKTARATRLGGCCQSLFRKDPQQFLCKATAEPATFSSKRQRACRMHKTCVRAGDLSVAGQMSAICRQDFCQLAECILPALVEKQRGRMVNPTVLAQTLVRQTPWFAPTLTSTLTFSPETPENPLSWSFSRATGTALTCRLSCAPGLCLPPALRRCSGGHWAQCRTSTRRHLLPCDVLLGVPLQVKGYKV